MRKIRPLMIAVLALGVLSIAPAGAAATDQFRPLTAEFPNDATVTSKSEVAGHFGGANVSCTGGEFTGTMTSEPLTTTKAANTPCVIGGEFKMNGCKLTFKPNTNAVDLGEPGCGPITFGKNACGGTTTIQPKTGLSATYSNYGTGNQAKALVEVKAKGLSYDLGWGCGSGTNGELVAVLDISTKKFGVSTGFLANYPGAVVGIYSGFSADTYPVSISGPNVVLADFQVPEAAIKWECPTVNLAGSLSGGSSVLNLTPTYSGSCKSTLGMGATIKPKSCQFSLQGTKLGVVCAKEGDQIEIVDGSGCTVKIAPQAPAGSIAYEQLGPENGKYFRAYGSPGLKMLAPGFICELSGMSPEPAGTVGLDATLKGVFGT